MTNPNGNKVAYLDYSVDGDTVHIEQITNSSHSTEYYERGTAEKLVDNIISQHPDKNIQWNATTPQGMQFKKKYFESHPELQSKTKGISTKEELDRSIENDYNAREGVLDEGSNRDNGKFSLESGTRENQANDISTTNGNRISGQGNNSVGELLPSDTPTNARRKNTSISNETQLQLNLTATPDNIGTSIAKGDINLTEEKSIDAIINHIIKTDIEISGKTFKDVASDADSYFNQALKDNPQKAAAYFNAQSPEILDSIARQQLAATKLLSVLKDVQANANPRENLRILTAVKDIEKYIEGVGSGFGRGLRYQSITKKAVNTFGSERFSALAMQGINNLADIIENVSLNFTREKSLQEFKAEVLQAFKGDTAYNEILNDRQLFAKLNEALEDTYKNCI